MSHKKVRYAVVGTGWFAQEAILPAFQNATENSELAAIVSGDPVKQKEVGERYGVPAYDYQQYGDLLESGNAHERIATAGTCFSNRRVPLDIAYSIVDRGMGGLLSPPPTDHCDFFSFAYEVECVLEPVLVQYTIPIKKLHKSSVRM